MFSPAIQRFLYRWKVFLDRRIKKHCAVSAGLASKTCTEAYPNAVWHDLFSPLRIKDNSHCCNFVRMHIRAEYWDRTESRFGSAPDPDASAFCSTSAIPGTKWPGFDGTAALNLTGDQCE